MFVFTNVTYEKPGGSENLVFLIAKYLMINFGKPVKIFGSQDSYLVKRLREERIVFHFYDINDVAAYNNVTGDDLLVLFNNYYGLKKFKKCSCRVVVWNILCPVILEWNNFNFEIRFFRRHIFKPFFNKALLRFLLRKDAFLCMDGSTRGCVEQFLGQTIAVDTVPIPIEGGDNLYIKRNDFFEWNSRSVQLSYIGRGDVYWKINPLKKVLSDLSVMNRSFIFNIFTSESDLYDEVLLPVLPKNVSIQYHLGYYGQRLRDKLVEVSDLNFSMGTSALESAVVGIPTILIDATDAELPKEYVYRWLYLTEEYSLGYHYTPSVTRQTTGYPMTVMIETILDPDKRTDMSQKCWQYVFLNHTVQNTVSLLEKHQGYVFMKDLAKYTPNMWF